MFGGYQSENSGYAVPGHSRKTIIAFSAKVRERFKINAKHPCPIWEIVEDIDSLSKILGNYDFQVATSEVLGEREGLVPHLPDGQNVLILHENVYARLVKNEHRARFTAAHELGHLLMRHNRVLQGLARMNQNIPIYQSAEWQANTFAGTLLLPPEMAKEAGNPHSASLLANVSLQAAEVTMQNYRKEGML